MDIQLVFYQTKYIHQTVWARQRENNDLQVLFQVDKSPQWHALIETLITHYELHLDFGLFQC